MQCDLLLLLCVGGCVGKTPCQRIIRPRLAIVCARRLTSGHTSDHSFIPIARACWWDRRPRRVHFQSTRLFINNSASTHIHQLSVQHDRAAADWQRRWGSACIRPSPPMHHTHTQTHDSICICCRGHDRTGAEKCAHSNLEINRASRGCESHAGPRGRARIWGRCGCVSRTRQRVVWCVVWCVACVVCCGLSVSTHINQNFIDCLDVRASDRAD